MLRAGEVGTGYASLARDEAAAILCSRDGTELGRADSTGPKW